MMRNPGHKRIVAVRARVAGRDLLRLAATVGVGLVPILIANLILDSGSSSTSRQVFGAWVGLVGGFIVVSIFGARLLIDGGLVPRLWVMNGENSVKIWSWWSILRGATVSADAARPLQVRKGSNRSVTSPGGLVSGWLALRDGRRRVGIIAYTNDPDAFFRRLVAQLEREGVPLIRQ